MTLGELLAYLDRHSGQPVLEGNAEETVAKALKGVGPDPLIVEIVAAIVRALPEPVVTSTIERATATTALGPIRLRAMGDDAPVTDLRVVERIVHTIDSAFNEEALAARPGTN